MPSSETSASAGPFVASPIRDEDLWLLFAVTLVAVGNVSSVAPAFPQVVEVFGLSQIQVGWIVTAYSLPGIVSAPLSGVLADRVGRKRVLVPTLLVFGLAGGACALARTFSLLLLLRVFQGAAAAPLVGLAVTMIGDRYEGRTRATAIGYNASVLNVGTAAYPAIGGGLAALTWYWPFALPLLAIPVGLTLAARLSSPPLDRASTLSKYLGVARRQLTDRRVAGLLGINLGIYILIFGGLLTYLPTLLDLRFGAPAPVAGGVIAVGSVASGVVASQIGRIRGAVSERRLIQGSLVLDAVALALMPIIPTVWGVGGASLLFGAAQGLNQPALQTRLTELASDASRGIVLSLNGMVLRLAQAIGPFLLGSALIVGGIEAIFYAAAVAALVIGGGAVVVLWSPAS